MEVTITIKLEDGSTKTIELQNANIATMWGQGIPYNVIDPSQAQLAIMGNLTVTGQIKNTSLVGNI